MSSTRQDLPFSEFSFSAVNSQINSKDQNSCKYYKVYINNFNFRQLHHTERVNFITKRQNVLVEKEKDEIKLY